MHYKEKYFFDLLHNRLFFHGYVIYGGNMFNNYCKCQNNDYGFNSNRYNDQFDGFSNENYNSRFNDNFDNVYYGNGCNHGCDKDRENNYDKYYKFCVVKCCICCQKQERPRKEEHHDCCQNHRKCWGIFNCCR